MLRRSPFDFNDVENDALLLVEGISDARFFRAFLRDGLSKTDVQIAQVGGNRGFRIFLAQTLKNANSFQNLRRLGIVRDADTDALAAFRSVHDALGDAGFPEPQAPWQTAQTDALRVSIAILPDGNAPGDSETLCLHSIADKPASVCVEQYITCMVSAGFPDSQSNKARLHAYLAIGREPGLRLGEAADAGVWDWTAPAFAEVTDFLRNL